MMKSYQLIETSQLVLLNEEKYRNLGNVVLTHDYEHRITQSSNTELVSLYKLQVTVWSTYYV